MASSQETATAAALTELHIPYQTEAVVISTDSGYPASTVLKAGDVIEAVDGKPVTGTASLSAAISAHPAGSGTRMAAGIPTWMRARTRGLAWKMCWRELKG